MHQPIYLWLIGIYPILYLYGENLGLVNDREVPLCLAAMLAGTTIAYRLVNRWIGHRDKTALILSLGSLVFSLSGHIYVLTFVPRSLFVWSSALLAALAVSVLIIHKRCPPATAARLSPIFNVIMLALLLYQGASMLPRFIAHWQSVAVAADYFPPADDLLDKPKVKDSTERPDIYYIIPDAYPSDDWHKESTGIDNASFTRSLLERGFVVARHAQSNYSTTLHSLAATLNMRYFDSNPTALNDIGFLKTAVADSQVPRQLLAKGYSFIFLNSGTLFPSPIADSNLDFGLNGTLDISREDARQLSQQLSAGQPFTRLYIGTTLLRIVQSQLEELRLTSGSEPTTLRWSSNVRFLSTLDELARIAKLPEATFTIAHLMKPHGPVTFNERGETVDPPFLDPSVEDYAAELQFVNSAYLRMIDAILASSQGQAVILFQADHGSTFGENHPANQRLTHFDVYAAYYLPPAYDLQLPAPYTLINAFPLLLNELFDSQLPWQEDRLYELLIGYDAPFDQRDVTEEFLHKPTQS